MTLGRKYIPLLSGGISDSAADQGGMDLTAALELENGFFNTPSSLSLRRGSVDGDRLMDDGVPAPVTSVPFLEFFPDRGKLFAIGHSTVTSRHYAYEVGTDGQNEAAPGSDILPVSNLPAAYDIATPAVFTGAAWFNKTFYATDVSRARGMFRFNGDTGVLDTPLFELGAGPPTSLRPIKIFVHNNHLIILGYGDENTPEAPDTMRSSLPGIPDQFDSVDHFSIGDSQEPLTNGLSLGAHGLLFKERRVHRLSGQVAGNWAFPEIDKKRGTVNARSAKLYDGIVWFLSEEGFAQIGLSGPSRLIVDKAKLAFASFDNFENCWVAVNAPERMVVFACHEKGESGTFPNLLVQVDARTLNWVVRDYLASGGKLFSMAAAEVPQITGAATGLGPVAPPVLTAPDSITANTWNSNWTEGDTSAGIRTIHESRNTDQGESFVEDGAVDVGTLTVSITGKDGGSTYEEQVKHEKNGLFSVPSNVGEVKTLLTAPQLVLDGATAAGIDVTVANGANFKGKCNIQLELKIAASPFFLVKTINQAPQFFATTIGGVVCDQVHQVRCRAVKAGFTDSAFSNIVSVTPCVGAPL